MASKHRRRHFRYSAGRLASLGKTIAAALFLAPQRGERFGMVVHGMRDYVMMRMGARSNAVHSQSALSRHQPDRDRSDA